MWFGRKKALEEIETVFCDHVSARARCLFADAGYDFASTPHVASLIWLRTKYRQYYSTLSVGQHLNHIPNQRELIDKGHLTKNIQGFFSHHPEACRGIEPFYPESYRLYVEEERERFFAQLPHEDSPENLWIVKPTDLSKGQGIEIFSKMAELRRVHERPPNGEERRFIVQRYIKDPLLLDGKKSEIRIYWLIASLNPFLVLMFPEGTVRLNTLPYTLDDLDNPLIHITNAFQQKSHPDYDPSAVLKWSFDGLRRYLADQRGDQDASFIGRELVETVKRYIEIIARATYPGLVDGVGEQGYFGLYGTDMIFDDRLKVWVTEVQKGPGLSYTDPVKKRVIPAMFTEAIEIVFEVRRRKLLGHSLRQLDCLKRYEWVINESIGR